MGDMDVDSRLDGITYEEDPVTEDSLTITDPSFLTGFESFLAERYGEEEIVAAPVDDAPRKKRSDAGEYVVDVTYELPDGLSVTIEEDTDDDDYAVDISFSAADDYAVDALVDAIREETVGDGFERDGVLYTSEPIDRPIKERSIEKKTLNGVEQELEETYEEVVLTAREEYDAPQLAWQDDEQVYDEVLLEVEDGDSHATVEISNAVGAMGYLGVLVDSEDTSFKQDVMATVRSYIDSKEDVSDHEYRRELDYGLGWEDVGGLAEQKTVLKKNVLWPRIRPDLYEALDLEPTSGVVFHGPPGTGKTLLAKTLASELDRGLEDDEVNFYVGDPDNLGSKYVSENPENVYELFREARAGSPSVIFLDEMDSLVSRRTDGSSGAEQERNDQINAFLQNMDGLEEIDDVVVIGATNRLENVDPAALRGGRFGEQLEVGEPSSEARESIWRIQTDVDEETSPFDDLDYGALVSETDGMVGADIEEITRKAKDVALEAAVDDAGGIEAVDADELSVGMEDVRTAIRQYRRDEDRGSRIGFQ